MNNSLLFSSLLSKGYFPQELPDVFTTQMFGENAVDVQDDWRKAGLLNTTNVTRKRKTRRDSYNYHIMDSEAKRITKPKFGYERRSISIPHPIPQIALSFEIANHWKTIAKWLSRTTFSVDRIRICTNQRRATPQINFELHQAKKNFIEASSDWLITTDITRFYPSIYTHSIAWAAYGKENVKSNRAAYNGSLADRIDQIVRSGNRNQTIGIPIGPDTSHIIAEIISARIDAESAKH
jgi:hypothetical protein